MNNFVATAVIGGIVSVLLYGIFAANFYYGLNDPSASAPLYAGPVIPDAKQQPLPSRFGHETVAAEVVEGLDLRGKTIVITGGHSGTGLEATKALASAGASVVALARDVGRARDNLRGVANVEVEYVDLLIPESIQAFAEKFLASGRPLHVLINSAGIMGTPLERDRRGYERQFATNVLGHFALTAQLLPALKRANGARIVNLASRGHRAGGVNFEDIHFERTEYSGMRAYAQTKTALILLTLKEDALWRAHGIRAYAVHPGPVPATDLFAAGHVGAASHFKTPHARLRARLARALHVTEALNFLRGPKNVGDRYKTVQQGAATTVWAAVSQDLDGAGGIYLEDCNIAVVVPDGSAAPFGVRPWALDVEAAERLWQHCEEMTGLRLAPDGPGAGERESESAA
jgi:NAD(P)-dependent dehydrogenase (short-subunit alcohol dehydrogenase family)